jgi:hypothetical protein
LDSWANLFSSLQVKAELETGNGSENLVFSKKADYAHAQILSLARQHMALLENPDF